MAKICELPFAAGAKRCLLPFADHAEIRSPDEIAAIRARPHDARGLELMTVQSARMARAAGEGATDASGRVFDVPGLHVADASLFRPRSG